MSGTDLASVPHIIPRIRYALSDTDPASTPPMVLRTRYAMPGTELVSTPGAPPYRAPTLHTQAPPHAGTLSHYARTRYYHAHTATSTDSGLLYSY
eukprot:614019-Rhodomonas_salina.2